MPKTITKKFTIYDLEDLKKDNKLCDRIYTEFWLDDSNTNACLDENIRSLETFAKTLYMILNYELSDNLHDIYRDFIVLTPKDDFYALENKNYKSC